MVVRLKFNKLMFNNKMLLATSFLSLLALPGYSNTDDTVNSEADLQLQAIDVEAATIPQAEIRPEPVVADVVAEQPAPPASEISPPSVSSPDDNAINTINTNAEAEIAVEADETEKAPLLEIGLSDAALDQEMAELSQNSNLKDETLPPASTIELASTPMPIPETIEIGAASQFDMQAAVAFDKEARDAILKPFEITYKAKYSGKGIPMKVNATRSLSKNSDKTWSFKFKAKNLLAKINETSSFDTQDAKIIPSHYRYKRTGLVKDLDDRLSFDWENNSAHNKSLKSEWTVELQESTFDKLSYQLQMRLDLSQGKTEFKYFVAERGKLKPYTFEIVREEELNTKIGKQNTVVLERVENKQKRRVTIWFAKDLNYTLVKLEQKEQKGEHYLVTIDKIKK